MGHSPRGASEADVWKSIDQWALYFKRKAYDCVLAFYGSQWALFTSLVGGLGVKGEQLAFVTKRGARGIRPMKGG